MAFAEVDDTELFQFDPRIFWINIRIKLIIPIATGILVAIASFFLAKVLIQDSWETSTFLIRHAKNMSSQSDIPYLYLQTDLNTVLETVLLRENLEATIEKLNLDISHQNLRKLISVSKGNKSNVVKINVTWNDPTLVVNIADTISEIFLTNYTDVQNAAATKIHRYYVNKLESTKLQLYEAHNTEKQFRESNQILDYEAQKQNLYKAMSELEIRSMDKQIELSEIESKLEELDLKINQTPKKIIISQVVRSGESNLIKTLKNQLEVLKRRYTEDNPKVQHLIHKISVFEIDNFSTLTEGEIFDETKYGNNPLYSEMYLLRIQCEIDIFSLQENLSEYQYHLQKTKEKIIALSDLEQKNYQLNHTISSQENMLNTLNNRLIETSIAMESNISDFDILEYAQTPSFPRRSYRKVIAIVVAAFMSIFILAIILVREFVSQTIKTEFDTALIPNTNLFGAIPNKDEVDVRYFYSKFYLFFSEINRKLNSNNNNLLTLSSLHEDEGKSFIANELIDLYSKQNKRILHIESEEYLDDVSDNEITNSFMVQGKSCNHLTPIKLGENVDKCYFSIDKRIYIDILEDNCLASFLASCKTEYDVVIWELFSPNIHLQLFNTINTQAGLNIVIAKSKVTHKSGLSRIMQMMKKWEIQHVGVLLNHLPKKYLDDI